MNRKSGAFSLPWIYRRQDALAIDGIFALVAGLLAFVLVLVAALVVIFLAKSEVSPVIADGVGVGSARWSVLGQHYSPYSEGSKGASVTRTHVSEEAYARNLALAGQRWISRVGGSPRAAQPPDPGEAHAHSLTLTGPGRVGPLGDQ